MNIFQSIVMPMSMTSIYTRKGGKKWNKSAKQHGLWLTLGLFLSPEKEHVVSICSLMKAGYTDTHTDSYERYFSFKVFVKDVDLKKSSLKAT